MDMYDRITILLKEKNTTKADMSKETGIPYSTIASMFSRRSTNIDVETIKKIASYLGTSVEYLFTGKTLADIRNKETNYISAYKNGKEQQYDLTESEIDAIITILEKMDKEGK